MSTSQPLPRARVPLSARRCTCEWDLAARRRLVADPFCSAQVLHADPTDDEIEQAAARAVELA